MMSTHGKVTDFQMWDEILPDEQLLKVKTETTAPVLRFLLPGDGLRRVSGGQPCQLGENQLVPQLKSRHGLNLIFSSNL